MIVGGGPAGLAAGIAVGRACRPAAVLDCARPGRAEWHQTNHNYLGFPDGIPAAALVALGRRQAERFGVEIHDVEVARLRREGERFVAEPAAGDAFVGRAVVLATGVRDRWPRFPGYEAFVGRTLHWCIVCDGYEMQGKRVVVVGNDEETAETALQMLRFTPRVTVVTNAGSLGMGPETVDRLRRRGVPLIVDRIAGADARERGLLAALRLERGETVPLDHLFSHQGADPNTALARSLGVAIGPRGYITVDTEGRTSQPRVYAAGDVTRLFAHQIATAVHEGATAAASLNYDLWREEEGERDAGVAAERLDAGRPTTDE